VSTRPKIGILGSLRKTYAEVHTFSSSRSVLNIKYRSVAAALVDHTLKELPTVNIINNIYSLKLSESSRFLTANTTRNHVKMGDTVGSRLQPLSRNLTLQLSESSRFLTANTTRNHVKMGDTVGSRPQPLSRNLTLLFCTS
jgi:hypothetical protein